MNGLAMPWSGALSAPAVDLLTKVTLLLALAALASRLLRRRSAALRHFVWQLALLGSLALTISPALPWSVRMPLPSWASPAPVIARDRGTAEERGAWPATPPRRLVSESAPRAAAAVTTGARHRAVPMSAWLVALWALGFIGVAAWSILGHVSLARLVGAARPVRDPAWLRLLARLAPTHLPGGSVLLLESDHLTGPIACGLVRPRVILPPGSESWSLVRKRAVLLHELAHLARRDPASQSLAWLACATYWFHPGVWAAARSLRKESERACDDRVLSTGFEACDYANELLGVARSALGLRLVGAAAIAMARRSSLEGRLLSLLDEGLERGRLGRRGRIVGALGLAAMIAVLGPLHGSPSDRVMAAARAPSLKAPASTTAPVTPASEKGPAPAKTPLDKALKDAEESLTTVAIPDLSRELLASKDSDDQEEDSEDGTHLVDEVSASPGGTLVLDLKTGGGVEIHGWDKHSVSVQGRLGGPDRDRQQASIERHGSEVQVSCTLKGFGSSSTSNHFDIQVPSRFNVRLRSSGGELTIVGVEGRFTGNTGGGEIVLEHVRGHASLSTGGGEIRVSDSDLSGNVSTGGGVVRLSNVRGGLNASSGSGPVLRVDRAGRSEDEPEEGSGDLDGVHIDPSGDLHDERRGAGGMLSFRSAGGGFHLDSAPHGVRGTTGGGNIVIGKANGPVDVSTGGGNIEIGPSRASVEAATGAGEIHVVIAGEGTKSRYVDLGSGIGRVVLELPADVDATLELETAYTESSHPARILSDWKLDPTVSPRWDGSEGTPRKYVRAETTLGSGAMRVRIKTNNGDIEVRRARR